MLVMGRDHHPRDLRALLAFKVKSTMSAYNNTLPNASLNEVSTVPAKSGVAIYRPFGILRFALAIIVLLQHALHLMPNMDMLPGFGIVAVAVFFCHFRLHRRRSQRHFLCWSPRRLSAEPAAAHRAAVSGRFGFVGDCAPIFLCTRRIGNLG